jgi:ABC-type bacteriocin/lantibiotic exporter with double-glycine peptidase domain
MTLYQSIKISLQTLDKTSRIKYYLVICTQGALALLDLLGVAVLGAIGALAIRGVQSKPAGNRLSEFLELARLDSFTFQQQVGILGVFAVSVLVLKTLLSIWVSRKTLFFLSSKASQLSLRLFRSCLFSSDVRIIRRKIADIQFAVGVGANSLTVGTLGTFSSIIADVCVVLTVGAGAFIVDPTTSVIAILLFSIVALVLYRFLHKKARTLGIEITSAAITTDEIISQAIFGFRELYTKNSQEIYSEKIKKTRDRFGTAYASQNFLPNISKYVIEIALIVGALSIAAIQFLLYDSTKAAASLTLFLAAGSRVGPALLRLQQNLVTIQAHTGAAEPTLRLIQEFTHSQTTQSLDTQMPFVKFKSTINLENVMFGYSQDEMLISNLNLELNEGDFLAIVGPSGSGKSTLLDLMLGLIKPNSGQIRVSGVRPDQAVQMWPGRIAYVPQDVFLINGTILENITFGYNISQINHEDLSYAIDNSALRDFVENSPQNLETIVQERGTSLSGGQKQRIGIARALITRPGILFLDEATSSLDSISEVSITKSIHSLKKSTTLIIVAHRLSTILKADKFLYISNEKIVQANSFEELRLIVPEFDEQAKVMGL